MNGMNDEQSNIIPTEVQNLMLEKLLGPTLNEIGNDIKKFYIKGRDAIVRVATRKTDDEDSGKRTNLRVTRDVFWNGSFTDEAICAEYFGGILASSRSEDGRDDSGIQYVNIIKSLSSSQLRLHYTTYNSLNKLFIETHDNVNVGQGKELQDRSIYFLTFDHINELNFNEHVDFKLIDLNALFNHGLIHEYKTDVHVLSEGQKAIPYYMIRPTTLGVLLYAIAHNRLDEWQQFPKKEFGDFQDIVLPKVYAPSLDDLSKNQECVMKAGQV